ncbi:hypothetical protein ACFLZN_02850 [Nanoarchaeota archaeon]
MNLTEKKTKFVFIGLHDQFVVNLDIEQAELKRKLMDFLRAYEGIDIGTAA